MSTLNKVLEDHQKDQRNFILITQDDMQHTCHAVFGRNSYQQSNHSSCL